MADFGKRKITVAGVEVELDTSRELPIADLDTDMDRVASQMGWWASVWAAAEGEKEMADAFYRKWRAAKTLEHSAGKPPPAEWKVRAMIEADPKFLEYKQAIARSIENAVLAKGVWESFAKKANLLQSRGAKAREEFKAGGMTTPESPRSAPERSRDVAEDPVSKERKDRLRETLKKSKTKNKET